MAESFLMGRKYRVIPNIKVNYSLREIIHACFIQSKSPKYLNLLKQGLCKYFGVHDVLLTSSGRSAIYHILVNLPQKKVIVPAYTCDVVVEAAKLAGKDIVYAHVKKETLNVDVELLPKVDSDCIVIATHLFGFPCDIKRICEICKINGAIVLEDCAGSFGTYVDGQLTGTFGDYAIFSFSASKLLNAPTKGGFIIAKNSKDLYLLKEKIAFRKCDIKFKLKAICKSIAFCLDKNAYIHFLLSSIRHLHQTKAYIPAETYTPNKGLIEDYLRGFYNWQAYVVLKQLERLPLILKKREELTDIYDKVMNYCSQNNSFLRSATCIRYPIYVKDREKKRAEMRAKGIEVGFGFEHCVFPSNYNEELSFVDEIAYLPFGNNYTKDEIDKIVSVLSSENL